MASVNEVHNNMAYEFSQPVGAAAAGGPVQGGMTIVNQPQPQPIVLPTMYRAPLPVGPRPIKAQCPSCEKQITSRTSHKNTCCCKCCICSLLFVSGVCLLCSFLPFCVMGPERVTHTCPKCNAHLGTWVNT
ncbi:Hypothetical protein NTJ_15542 [Nesidiocoris tenuis]|nr:Hypothetical protein NTJ_15542 [Nesidiocoris tenuis]